MPYLKREDEKTVIIGAHPTSLIPPPVIEYDSSGYVYESPIVHMVGDKIVVTKINFF